MSDDFDLKQLSVLVDIPVRAIRFYMQKGLVDRSVGARKTARYTTIHLEQLLLIKKWKEAGLSLNRIASLLNQGDISELPPMPQPKVGDVRVVSQVYLAEGIQLQIEPEKSGLDNKAIRSLVNNILTQINALQAQNKRNEK